MMSVEFNEKYRSKTKNLAIRIIKMYGKMPKTDEARIIGKQLIRSVTSVAANFRASTRARSDAEHYAKFCIVVEESDETLFWLEILEETEIIKAEKLTELKKDAQELLSIFASTRKKLKS